MLIQCKSEQTLGMIFLSGSTNFELDLGFFIVTKLSPAVQKVSNLFLSSVSLQCNLFWEDNFFGSWKVWRPTNEENYIEMKIDCITIFTNISRKMSITNSVISLGLLRLDMITYPVTLRWIWKIKTEHVHQSLFSS